jgi:hypothetical protein
MFLGMNVDLIHLVYPIQYELWFLSTILVRPGAGAETFLYRLRPKVSAPSGSSSGSGSTTMFTIVVEHFPAFGKNRAISVHLP